VQTLFAEIKNFIFKNLMTFVVLAVSAFLLVLILLWVTLLSIWVGSGVDAGVVQQIAVISATVIFTVLLGVVVLVFANKARLDRARAASLEAEVARNLVVINEYRQAVLDYEKASNGKK
jgi:magnesium-transporting ATPase (P-type)